MAVNTKISFVAILPNGEEHFEDLVPYSLTSEGIKDAATKVADNAVRLHGLTTSRNDPKKIIVEVKKISINKGKLERSPYGKISVMPPIERLTQEEYEKELETLLAPLPDEFKSFVRNKSWSDGHSAGYEEVISIADDLVDSIMAPLKEYTNRLVAEQKAYFSKK